MLRFLQTQIQAAPLTDFNPVSFLLKHGTQTSRLPVLGKTDPDYYLKNLKAHRRWPEAFSFVEGFAQIPGSDPTPHCWLQDQHGGILDPYRPEATDYFGAAFTLPPSVYNRAVFSGVFDPKFLASLPNPWKTLESWLAPVAQLN